jgi:aquaporin Z
LYLGDHKWRHGKFKLNEGESGATVGIVRRFQNVQGIFRANTFYALFMAGSDGWYGEYELALSFRLGMELMKIPGVLFFSELVGTALLISVGLSIVILDFSPDSPVVALVPSAGLRRFLTGFLFGTTGGLIALSPVGKISGAHINRVVTAAFWLRKKIGAGHALGYILAQLTGAIAGAVPLLLWGRTGEAVHFGASLPGARYTSWEAALGEAATTFALIVLLFLFLGQKPIRKFTPLLFPFLYAAMVCLEAPLSGTSTNPARSLGAGSDLMGISCLVDLLGGADPGDSAGIGHTQVHPVEAP